jgi:ubiquitin C-terminal hydrolase
MFGLHNFRGSCWVNTCLQAIFRIPEIQERYNSETFEKINDIDDCMNKIWKTKGEEGLKQLFEAVRTEIMPAGNGIGDAHELLQSLCDKLPFLDTLMRYKVADSIKCINCEATELKEDTVLEFELSSQDKNKPMSECIVESMKENVLEDWKCDKCSKNGCKKQQLIGTFPKVMVFHMTPTTGSIDYSSILALNQKQYALISVCCYDNIHWWAYGRNMPPGSSWFSLNDKHIQEHGPKQFPLSNKMRLLIYYRLDN